MRRSVGAAIVGALALVSSMAVVAPADAATTIVVGTASATCTSPDYATIAAAVAAASDGDTIQVCSGSYDGGIDDQGKDLTFLGALAGVPGPSQDGGADESSVFIPGGTPLTLTGASTVDGFELSALGDGFADGADLSGHQTVRNCRIEGVHIGAVLNGPDVTFEANDVNIPDNTFNFATIGVELPAGGGANALIQGNTFHGTLDGGAISINQDASPANVSGVAIASNTVNLDAGHFVLASQATDLTISGNTVTAASASDTNMIGFGDATTDFSVRGNTFSGPEAGVSTSGGSSANGHIVANTFTGNSYGYYGGASTGAVTLTSNHFHGEQTGAVIVDGEGTVAAHSNVFDGDAVGVQNNATASLDATDNFWGCNTGPNTAGCDTTVGTVGTSTFLVLSSTIGSHTVPVGQTTTFSADLNHDNHGAIAADPVLDGLAVHFSFDKGTVTPADSTIVNGRRSTSVHRSAAGSGTVSATVLNATTSQAVNTPAYRPRISAHDAGTAEGNSGTHPLRFTVSLNHATAVPTTVRFTTANGSATAGSDFIARSGTLTIPAGHTSGTISVSIKGDRTKERNEQLALNIYAPSIGTLADPVGTGTIRNDD